MSIYTNQTVGYINGAIRQLNCNANTKLRLIKTKKELTNQQLIHAIRFSIQYWSTRTYQELNPYRQALAKEFRESIRGNHLID